MIDEVNKQGRKMDGGETFIVKQECGTVERRKRAKLKDMSNREKDERIREEMKDNERERRGRQNEKNEG